MVLTARLPGVEPDDLDIAVEGNVLTLRRAQKERERQKGEMYHRHECRHGSFARSWQLPFEVEQNRVDDYQRQFRISGAIDVDKIDARMKNGVLQVTLRKSKKAQPQKISVKAG